MEQKVFNIGEQVMTLRGVGTIEDKLVSAKDGAVLYSVDLGDDSLLYEADELEPLRIEYSVDVTVADNVVIGVIYESRNGKKAEVARGHGHIIHQGVLGIAQAASYALRKAWQYLSPDIE